MTNHASEVDSGNRFEFGVNWTRFLKAINEERIFLAQQSLGEMLGVQTLRGKRFLDVGSGSGLSSLAARRLGAMVHSFDYDPQSVACTGEMRRRYFPEDPDWTVQEASVLDKRYLSTLGQADVVYSWGVLHHTGRLWDALENTIPLVKAGGHLYLAIYNDQGDASRRWKYLKRLYNRHAILRFPLALYTLVRQWTLTCIKDVLRGHPFASWRDYKVDRGMSPWHDVVDWIGGYPFEVAKPEEIFDLCSKNGFQLVRLKTCAGGIGCNEFVFVRASQP